MRCEDNSTFNSGCDHSHINVTQFVLMVPGNV